MAKVTVPAGSRSDEFIRLHREKGLRGKKVRLKNFQDEIDAFKNDLSFESIAEKLGEKRPRKDRTATVSDLGE